MALGPFRIVVVLSFIAVVGFFVRDVFMVTQDRIGALKRDVVLAVEQRDAVRADLTAAREAQSQLTASKEELEKSHASCKDEISRLQVQHGELNSAMKKIQVLHLLLAHLSRLSVSVRACTRVRVRGWWVRVRGWCARVRARACLCVVC